MDEFFTPYVEGPTEHAAFPTTHVSGSDTTTIDHMRQGVEITMDKFRYTGVLPKLGSGDDQHRISVTVYGQSKEFRSVVPFEELVDFDPVVYLNDQDALIFPAVQNNASLEDPERLGGFIEPLSIGSRDPLLSTTEYQEHTIRGNLSDGNEDYFGKCDRIVSTRRFRETSQTNDLYIDAASSLGSGSGSILLPGTFAGGERTIEPFNETSFVLRSMSSGSFFQISTPEIRAALLAMTGSASDTYISFGVQSLGVGFTYDFNSIGTDSIAFGGLKRS